MVWTKLMIVTNACGMAFSSLKVFVTKFMVIQLCQARQDVYITTSSIQTIFLCNVPRQFIAEAIMRIKQIWFIMSNASTDCPFRNKFPITLYKKWSILCFFMIDVVFTLAVFQTANYVQTINFILEHIAE